jgi:hypothetical protein
LSRSHAETRSYRQIAEWLAFAFAAVMTAVAVWLVPAWTRPLTDPCQLAIVLGVLTMLALFVARFWGGRGHAIERQWLAAFLFGMPLVYVASLLTMPGPPAYKDASWIQIELFGVIVFGVLAWLGLTRTCWFLVWGIAAHGLAWDSWHLDGDTPYVPVWYARGCLLVDIGIAVYLAVRLWFGHPRHRAHQHS